MPLIVWTEMDLKLDMESAYRCLEAIAQRGLSVYADSARNIIDFSKASLPVSVKEVLYARTPQSDNDRSIGSSHCDGPP